MTPTAPAQEPQCPQCGAAVTLGDDAFVRCVHCRGSLYADVTRLVRHVTLRPRLAAGEAKGALERFLRAAEVDSVLRDCSVRLEYHPWWAVPQGAATRLVQGAAETAFEKPPRRAAEAGAGDPYDPDLADSATVVAPQLSADDALARAHESQRQPPHAESAPDAAPRLLHVPVWRIDFAESGRQYRALVDAVEGDVDALSLPPSASRRLDRVAAAWFAATFLVFAIEAAVLPGFWLPLVAMGLTGWAFVALVRRGERSR